MLSSVSEYRTFFRECCSAKTLSDVKKQHPDLALYIHGGVLALKSTDISLINSSIVSLLKLGKKENFHLYTRIQEICRDNGLMQETCELRDYQTRNLIPVKQEKGKYGGSLITVKVDREFRFATADSDLLKYKSHTEEWKLRVQEYQKQYKEWEKNPVLDKPTFPIKPFLPAGNPTAIFEYDKKNIHQKFPSYSANPHSEGDPQGDIGWILLLPKEVQAFFGFARCDDYYTFPDIDEFNGAIEEFNEIAKKLGFGDNYLSMRLRMVNTGPVSNDDYLYLRSQNILPVSAPKHAYSWFYHDYLYHVIGMLLTPPQALITATRFVQEYQKLTNEIYRKSIKETLTDVLDHSTTWALRIGSLLYLDQHEQQHDFYCFDVVPPNTFKEIIIIYACFVYIKDIHSEFKNMSKQEFVNRLISHAKWTVELNPSTSVDPFKNLVREHFEKMKQISAVEPAGLRVNFEKSDST